MQVHLYIHETHLDKLNKFITGKSLELEKFSIFHKLPTHFTKDYTDGFVHISLGYDDYIKTTDSFCG